MRPIQTPLSLSPGSFPATEKGQTVYYQCIWIIAPSKCAKSNRGRQTCRVNSKCRTAGVHLAGLVPTVRSLLRQLVHPRLEPPVLRRSVDPVGNPALLVHEYVDWGDVVRVEKGAYRIVGVVYVAEGQAKVVDQRVYVFLRRSRYTDNDSFAGFFELFVQRLNGWQLPPAMGSPRFPKHVHYRPAAVPVQV